MLGRTLMGLSFALLLLGCEGPTQSKIPPQTWQGIRVAVETRPTPVRAGMNEIWVIFNDQRRRPVSDLLVELSVSGENKAPVQAIQDGLSGVYRRAVYISEPATQQLQIHLRRGENRGLLTFPLIVDAAAPEPVSGP